MKSYTQRYLDSITAIQEIRTMNPKMLLTEIYKLLCINRAALNSWTKENFGLTVAELVKKRMAGEVVRCKKHFHVKQYVELTKAGLEMLLKSINKQQRVSIPAEAIASKCYGAIDQDDMLCFELAARGNGPYSSSTLVYTNFAMRDPALFEVVPHTTPGVLLGIQKRNLGLE